MGRRPLPPPCFPFVSLPLLCRCSPPTPPVFNMPHVLITSNKSDSEPLAIIFASASPTGGRNQVLNPLTGTESVRPRGTGHCHSHGAGPCCPGRLFPARRTPTAAPQEECGKTPRQLLGCRDAGAKNAPCPGSAVSLNRCCLVAGCARKRHILLWARRNASQINDTYVGFLLLPLPVLRPQDFKHKTAHR